MTPSAPNNMCLTPVVNLSGGVGAWKKSGGMLEVTQYDAMEFSALNISVEPHVEGFFDPASSLADSVEVNTH